MENQNISNDAKADFKKAALALRAINHPLRQSIIEHLWFNSSAVTPLYVHFRLEQSVISQHLAILRKAGFVKASKSGKTVTYTTDVNRYQEYLLYANQICNVNLNK